MAISDVQIQDGTAPAAPAAPVQDDLSAGFPPIEQIPVIQAVRSGEPAAVFATKDDKDSPQATAIAVMANRLPEVGLALFANKSVGVLFNPEILSPQEVAKAVKSGDVKKIAVPISQFESAVNRVLEGEEPDMEALNAEMQPAAPQAGPPPAPAETRNRINSARVSNLQKNAPSQGPAPGRGIINDLMKRAI